MTKKFSPKKMKRRSGPGLWQRLNRPSLQQPLPGSVRLMATAIVIVALVVVPGYLYWAQNVAPYGPGKPGGPGDPWTTIWNGQTSAPAGWVDRPGGRPYLVQTADSVTNPCFGSCTVTITPERIGNLLLVTIFGVGAASPDFSVTDSSGGTDATYACQFDACNVSNDFFQRIFVGFRHRFSPFGSYPSPGSPLVINVTRDSGGASWRPFVSEWGGVGSATFLGGGTDPANGAGGGCVDKAESPDNSMSCYGVFSHSGAGFTTGSVNAGWLVVSSSTVANDIGVSFPVNTQNGTAFTNNQVGYCLVSGCGGTTPQSGNQAYGPLTEALVAGQSYNLSRTISPLIYNGALTPIRMANSAMLLKPNDSNCMQGYQCWYSSSGTNGTTILWPNAASMAVALSNAAVDMSPAVSKNLGLYETFRFGSFNPTPVNEDKAFGWFLTVNSTLSQDPDWSPLSDEGVAMAFVVYYEGSNNWHALIYMQKSAGRTMLEESGQGIDPATCLESATIFLCHTASKTIGVSLDFQMMSLTLNYTGGATGGSGNQRSYDCFTNDVAAVLCPAGGAGQTSVAVQSPNATSYTLPWFRLQGQGYHMGFWAERAHSAGRIEFGTGTGSASGLCPISQPIISCANVISVFVPDEATNSSQVDTGGFFGWLGRTLGGAWNAVAGPVGDAIGQIAGPLFDLGSSLMGALAAGLIQAVTLMAKGLEAILNALGSLWGNSSFGTDVVAIITGVFTFVAGILSAVGSFLTQMGTAFLDAVTFILVFVVGGFFTAISTVIGIIVAIAEFMFTLIALVNLPLSLVFFMDWCFGILQVWFRGLRGLIAWIHLNILILTGLARGIEYIVAKVLWYVRSIKQLIPLLG